MLKDIETLNGNKITTLTVECVKHLHDLLSQNYDLLEKMDPIQPKGVKDTASLESAVARQFTGIENWYKYNDCFSNCATLIYGIIKNHAFFNGNKRTGLLCLIKHLYSNGYVLRTDLKSDELYNLIVSIASNNLKYFSKRYYYNFFQKRRTIKWDDDLNIYFLKHWININTVPKNSFVSKTPVKIRKVKDYLQQKNMELIQNGKEITIKQYKKKSILGIPTRSLIKQKSYKLGKKELNEIKPSTIKKIRQDFRLSRYDGVDDVAFFDSYNFLDEEIKVYKSIIYRLSKT